tara:strand:- start:41 stop:376 length:336 start_codon:yes stop_codon:yes gene_type:complete
MTEDMIVDMLDHRESGLDERTKAALDLAEDFILNHARNVNDEFMDRLKQHFSEEEIVELTIAIGTWDSVHKFNAVFDVDPPISGDGELFETGVPDVPEDMTSHIIDPGNKY